MKNGFQLAEIKILLQSKLGDLHFVQKADGKDIVFCEPNNMKTALPKEEKVSTKQVAKRTKIRQKQNEAKKEDKKDTTLKQVRITNIPKKSQIWYLDTWDSQAIEQNKKLIGLGVRDKAVDGILMVFDKEKQYLTIYFIELKSSLPNAELSNIVEKVKHSISRFLLFLCLNENQHNKEPFVNARVEFKTILFFNRMAEKIDVSTEIELSAVTRKYQEMQTKKLINASCLPTFETLLGDTPNPFKFVFRDTEEIITISFDDLVKF
jgi:hypothetical protein